MKNFKNSALIILAVVLLSGCDAMKKMVKDADQVVWNTTPEVLEMHGGEVDVKIDVQYPPKYFNSKALLTITPVVKYADGETELQELVVQGEKVTENYTVINNKTGGKASVSTTFKYEKPMMKSELVVKIVGKVKDKEYQFEDVKLADGIIATPTLVAVNPKVIAFKDNFKRITPEEYVSDIKYKKNRADVRRSETKKEEMVGLTDFFKVVNENERKELKSVEISAYASPEGEVDFNDKLSVKRQKSGEKYLKSQLKKSKVEVADELLSLLATPEDWEGFKKLMEASSIEDKEMILRVLSMHSDPDVREQEIRNITAAYKEIETEILPPLRRSKFTVKIDNIGWSDDELKELWTSNPDTLTLEELLYTAALCEDMKKKAAIYKKAVAVAPKCVRAHNNLGYAMYKQGDLDAAEAAFTAAKELKDHDIVNNNLGAIALMKKDLTKADELFTSSLGAGTDVNYNLGIINIIGGDYGKALNYLGAEPTFNKALAQYLSGNTNAAYQTVVALAEESCGRYYLIAVISASEAKTDVALENLKKAVEMKPALKERAKNDLEFADLFENADFKAIVE